MNKILIKSAIKNESIFYINNNLKTFDDDEYYSVNGRIKFIGYRKIKLSEYKLEKDYKHELLENPIVEITFEYVNLNHTENNKKIFANNCNLVDLDNFEFRVLDEYCLDTEEIRNYLHADSDDLCNYGKLIPKLKYKIKLFFLVPDEETDYYFEIVNGIIEEI